FRKLAARTHGQGTQIDLCFDGFGRFPRAAGMECDLPVASPRNGDRHTVGLEGDERMIDERLGLPLIEDRDRRARLVEGAGIPETDPKLGERDGSGAAELEVWSGASRFHRHETTASRIAEDVANIPCGD